MLEINIKMKISSSDKVYLKNKKTNWPYILAEVSHRRKLEFLVRKIHD